jgi:lysophospholipase L1-like esterase
MRSIRKVIPFLLVSILLWLPMGCRLIKADPKTAFLGDSLTLGWHYPQANFGVFGNTTAQMLGRFEASIPGHQFTQVVILGGTNDVLLGVDPNVTTQNLAELAAETVQAGAQPVLCEIPPIFHSYIKTDNKDYSEQVRILNERIARLAAAHQWKLADYYHPMLGHRSYSSDGVHLRRRGYAIMELEYLRAAPAS